MRLMSFRHAAVPPTSLMIANTRSGGAEKRARRAATCPFGSSAPITTTINTRANSTPAIRPIIRIMVTLL
jgi:hypothetical protein